MPIRTYIRQWKHVLFLACGIAAVLYALWYTSGLVLANRTQKTAHIFPTNATAVGWSEHARTLQQELAENAPRESFNVANSAYIHRAALPPSVPDIPPEPPHAETLPTQIEVPTEQPPESLTPEETPRSGEEAPSGETTESESATTTSGTETNAEEDVSQEPEPLVPATEPEPESEPEPELQPEPEPEPEPAPELPLPLDSATTSPETPPEVQGTSTEEVASSTEAFIGERFREYAGSIFSTLVTTASAQETATSTNATTTDPEPAPPDVQDVATCTILQKECLTLELSGFGVDGELKDKKLQRVELKFSFANSAPEGDVDDKLLLRYFHDGQWREAGEIFLNKELSNAANGGYFTQVLNDVEDWDDLAHVKVVVEYDRQGGGPIEAYLDALWLDVVYKDRVQDILSGISGEEPETSDNVSFSLSREGGDGTPDKLVLPDGTHLFFLFTDEIDDDRLVMRADKLEYWNSAASTGDAPNVVFLSVTNTEEETDEFSLFAAFSGKGTLREVSQFMRNVPTATEETVRNDVTYFCEGGWEAATSTTNFRCGTTGEEYQCSRLTRSRENCLVRAVPVATEEIVSYGSEWVPAVVSTSSDIVFEGDVPEGYSVQAATESFTVHAGQTLYFRVVLDTDDVGPQQFALFAQGRFAGDLESILLRDEAEMRAEETRVTRAEVKKRVNTRLSNRTNFDGDELPHFRFQFKTQRGVVARFWNRITGRENSFSVEHARVRDSGGRERELPVEVKYGKNGEWTLEFKKRPRGFRPGKHSVEITVNEAGETYTETYEFYWGVLAVNTNKSVYAPREEAHLMMAVLDDVGSTICDAVLDLSVTDPNGVVNSVDVRESGECGPNNVVDVADYLADYATGGVGSYTIALSSLDDAGTVMHRITDTFEVQDEEFFVVERSGPTRIYPKAPYTMGITVRANRDFSGKISEYMPQGFVLLEKDGGELNQYGDILELSWLVTMQKGEERIFRYEFDAPDISPYLYILGPLTLRENEALQFEESRSWKIASDALGNYIEKHSAWTPTVAGSWEAKSLASSPFNVPANAIVEIAVVNSDTNDAWIGGVRHASSSLTRSFNIHEAEPQGTTEFVMHVQASATSSIQTYAEDLTGVSFILIGYWTNGYYRERFDQIDPGLTDNTWGNINLNSFGVASGTVAEMVIGNFDGATELVGGVRSSTSTVRSVEIHESEGPGGISDGVNGVTMLVKASTTNATIQGFAEVEGANNASIDYFLIGYWSVNPTGLDYTERFSTVAGPGSASAWTDTTLSTFGVTPNAIAEMLFADTVVDNSSIIFGARADGSGIDRTFNIHETEGGGGGTQGWSMSKAHVKAGSGSNATIDLYTDNITDDAWRLLGFWSATNTPPNAPTLYDYPFESQKTGTSTPEIRFSATDPDGTSSIVYQVQWDDDAILDDSPVGDRISSNESGCSPNCFQDLTTADTSPFNEGDQIEFTVQTPLVSGTTYYWRVRAYDVQGSNIDSEWSTTTSFTYVANTSPPQWFQTQDTQFDQGTFSNTETYGSNAVRLTASSPVEALVAYGEGVVQTPRYRIWDGDSWGAEASAQSVGGTIQWLVTKAAPTRNEYLLATQDASNDVNVQVYDGDAGTWADLLEVTAGVSDNTARGVDITYESTSGDALVVYCDGDADPSYRVWNGNSWVGPTTINLVSANNCEWIKLASDPASDEIILVARDTAAGANDYEALVWDGSAWSNSSGLIGNMTDALNEGIAIGYEESGDQAVMAVSNGDTSGVAWASWSGTEWSVPSTQSMGDDFEWGVLKQDDGSDNMVLCYADQDDDIGILRWDGDGWQSSQEFETGGNTAGDGTVDGRPVSCEFETTTGRDGYIMLPHSSTASLLYEFWNGSVLSGESTISTIQDSWTVQSVRTGDGKVLVTSHDDPNSRYDFSYWNGSSWSVQETLENSASVTAEPFREPLGMAARLYQAQSGTLLSDPIDFDWVPGQPSWGEVLWSTTEPSGTDATVQVYYGATCSTLIPNGDLSGNSAGFDASLSPLDISSISTTTYNQICVRTTLTSTNQNVPTLNDWSVTWERQPYLTQERFRWYVNTNALTPTDPWPSGGTDIAENTGISTDMTPNKNDVLRLRMSILNENVALSASSLSLTLQYAVGASCSADMTWQDVGAIGSTTALWRGSNNSNVSDGATLSGVLLTTSDVNGTYEEENDSTLNPNGASADQELEYDWVIQHNASSSIPFCFRAITAEGETLNAYDTYPSLITNAAPGTPLLEKPFDNEAVASTSPWFEFAAEDPEGNDVTYQIQVDDNYDFSSPTLDSSSQAQFNDFTNIITPSDKDPFNSGQTVRYSTTTALSNNTTYYWRVRAKDRNNSTDWSSWSGVQSITINTSITITTWFQTRLEQFAIDSHDDTEATSTNDVVLTPPFTTGTTTSPSIDFDEKTNGNAWGSLSWTDDEATGDILYHLEYLNGSTWELIPDADLAGNAAGFDASPVTLLGLSPTTYNEIRIRANFTNIGGTPRLNDWTVSWGFAVEQPTVTALFDNEKSGTTTPTFLFYSTDPQSDDLVYELSISQTTDFAASTTRSSDLHSGFANTASSTDTSPFADGDSISFKVQQADALTNNTTYWWRVRARDPSGGNAWSVWSTLRSFTVDTSVNVSTWFQTTDSQFDTDTLNSTETYGSDNVRITTTIREAFLAYAEGTVQAPRYRIWNGTSWGNEFTGENVGVAIRFVESAAAPTRDEYVIATMGSTGVVDVQVYNGNTDSTGNLVEVDNAASDPLQRGFDVAYETSSGDALVVSCDGTEAVYRTWNGTNWTATSTFALAITNNCEWIKLASDPTSDEIILVARDTTAGANDYEALVWSGSAWANSNVFGSQATANNEGIAVEYEESGGQALVVLSNGLTAGFIWDAWNGTNWAGTNAVALGDDFGSGRLVRDLGSDEMALCYVDFDDDIGSIEWTGSGWGVASELELTGQSQNGRPVTCEYETTAGRDNYLMVPYSDTTQAEYQFWDGGLFSGPAALTTISDSWELRSVRTGDGNILVVAYDDANTEYDFTYWDGTSWSTEQVLETSSIATLVPATIPLDIVARRYPSFNSGTAVASSIDFDDGLGPKWSALSWTDSTPGGSDILYQLEYFTSTSTWALIPDVDLPGNSAGTTTSPLDLGNLSRTTYNVIRPKANLNCSGGQCPILNDWTLQWSEGLTVSGTAQQYDQSANVTSGTVVVAVNGTLQAGKQATISNGAWSIPNVTIFQNDIVTVFIEGAATSSEAVGVTKYDGEGDVTGITLYERHLSVGSNDNPTVTNADLGQYDNSVSSDEDVFHEVDAGNDLAACYDIVQGCADVEIWVKSGTNYRPDSASSGNVTTNDIEINGTVTWDGNTATVSGSWDNNGTSTANTSTVIFTATSTTETIDSTGAVVASFNNVTFGQTSGTATWTLSSTLDVNGALAVNFGTLSPGARLLTIAGNLTIGSSGLFTKGSATTTFDGSGTSTWTDNSSPKQDMGTTTVDGSTKVINLGSNVKATNLSIGADDTLDVTSSNYAIEVTGNFANNNVFTARSGAVSFTATDPGHTIVPGASSFYDLTFNGSSGNWAFSGTTVTVGNNLTITNGIVTLPTATTTVTGNFEVTSGSFMHNNGVFLANASGAKTLQPASSSFYDLTFNGTGSWSFIGANATSSRTTTITAGTVTLPGVMAVGGSFLKNGGSFTHNSGVLKFTATNAQTVRLGGSDAYNLTFDGSGGSWAFADTNATSTNIVRFDNGSVTLPSGIFAVGGSWLVTSGSFAHNNGTVKFNSSDTGETINPAGSWFYGLLVDNSTGGWTITAHATSSATTTLARASSFALSSGQSLAVSGAFANSVGGASTTWTGSTLFLNSGTTYSINSKTTGGDSYATLRIASSTDVKMWNSFAGTTDVLSASSLYSQDHAAIDGDLYIWGEYAASDEYWNYANDFDGASLTGSERQANVRIQNNSRVTLSSGTLRMVGGATATTTVQNQGTGTYAFIVSGGTLNAQYYSVRNTDINGLYLLGTPTVSSLANGDFELGVNGGTMLSLDATVINQNPTLQIQQVYFATSTGILTGSNILATTTPTSYWWFRNHYGNYDGEDFDVDPGGNPGYIRWDDSAITITVAGTVYSGHGPSAIGNPPCDDSTPVVRVVVSGATVSSYSGSCNSSNGSYSIPNVAFTGDVIMTTYLNTDGGARAVTVTKTPTADIANMHLYRDALIVRHEDAAAMTIADLAVYDKGDDSDITFTAATGSPNTLSTDAETELVVWSGKAFAPGGNISLESGGSGNGQDGRFYLEQGATFTAAGSESHAIGGGLTVGTTSTFTAANSTITFNATTTNKSVNTSIPLSLYNVTFNGSGGGWSLDGPATTTVQNNFLMSNGTLSGTSSVVVASGDLTGNGAIAMTGGTVTLQGGGDIGGNTPWQFFNLTLGSGTSASTVKTGSGTTTVASVLRVRTSQTLQAGSAAWVLSGGGTPFVVDGTFSVQTAPFVYNATTATNIADETYTTLRLAPSGIGSPTYAIMGGTLTADYLFVGDGINPVTVTADTNDPSMNIVEDVTINPAATLIASNVGALEISGGWINLGAFTHSNGSVLFESTDTGETIFASSSPFYNVTFDHANGGWTLAGSATSSNNFTLSNANTFTLASGQTLGVGGTFSNSVGGSATTWVGSTLFLHSSTTYSINTKTAGADIYGTLFVASSTDVRMWNSSAVTTTVDSTSSLYSQDHATTDGDLYIWGQYVRSSGSDYWSYDTDFDGTSLGGSSRQVDVRVASSSSVAMTGGVLDIIGTTTASTTIANQGAGRYAFAVSGGALNAQYYSVRNTDALGVSLSGAPTITSLSSGDYELDVPSSGTMLTVAGSVIDANPLKILMRNSFSTTTNVVSGANVTATGVTGSSWKFNLHYGNFDGEAYDSDPTGDPGYLRWDDSAAQITIAGNVYSDEGSTVSGECDGSQVVRLMVQGVEAGTSSCTAGTGAYSIPNVSFNPGDVLTVYLNSDGGPKAANISIDPVTNISNMHLYENRVIVRHEDTAPLNIADMAIFDSDQDADIPFDAEDAATDTLFVPPETKLLVWDAKTFAPAGNVTLESGGSGNAWDGTLELKSGATFSAASTQSHSVGGSFLASSTATLTPASSTFTLTATTTGKTLQMSGSSFYNLVFNGTGGNWAFNGAASTTNDFTITTGTVTLSTATTTVGGSFSNTGGTFMHNNGVVVLTATASGKTIRSSGSNFYNLTANGVGGAWTFADTNATSTNDFSISAGSVTLPSGTFAVGGSFQNAGTFTHSSGTVKLTSLLSGKNVQANTSNFYNLLFNGIGGEWTFTGNATTTNDFTITNGSTTLPSGISGFLAVAGSFTNGGNFTHASGTVKMNAGTTGKNLYASSSPFYNLTFDNGSGGWTITGNATTTNNFTLNTANSFTLSSSQTLTVGGIFTNGVGGAATTWTGTTLSLQSSTSTTINTKSAGGDLYATLVVGPNTDVRMWNSSAGTTNVDVTSSLYSQDHAAVDGDLYIWGDYARTTGTDYWSYATDFDGTALGGSSRQVDVRIASSSTVVFNGGSLSIVGASGGATTTVANQGAGRYALSISGGTLNANYYQFRNLDPSGFSISGSPVIASLAYGDFEMDVPSAGTMMTIAAATIDANASFQITSVRFATSTGVTDGFNVTRSGSPVSAWTFIGSHGNYDGEANDFDGGDACGQVRWDDSACLFISQEHFRWRNDNGGEGVPASEWYNASWTKRKKLAITNPNASSYADIPVKVVVTYDGDMQSDFDDLRFTDSSGTAAISYWIESVNASASSTVWVEIPSLPASGSAIVYMYYGNGGVASGADGSATFSFFDDFEDDNITEYSGDTSLFNVDTSFNHNGSFGLEADAGDEGEQTTSGIRQTGNLTAQGQTIRFFQYVDASQDDEPCALFAVGGAGDNYAVCLDQFPSDAVVLAEDVDSNDGSGTSLDSEAVTFSTGWYEVEIDWLTDNSITATVYDSSGSVFATVNASDSSNTQGGMGFSFWGQHGGWDFYSARQYTASDPTYVFGAEQADSGATWKAAEDTTVTGQHTGENVRLRFSIQNTGAALFGRLFRLQYAPKGASLNCESVPYINYNDVPTTTGGCGSAPACMMTSSQFSDQSDTAGLLTYPASFAFASGKILEDPSNQTSSSTVASSAATEVEYNFEMTNNATQNSYCFRTSHGGLSLDNYAHVAEVVMSHAPIISNFTLNNLQNIVLTEGATTTIYATGTVSDFNGYEDLVEASSTIYRSGVGAACSQDFNSCYQIASTSCGFIDCAGTSCTLSCSSDVYYFADPTDPGSTYSAENWLSRVQVEDSSGETDVETSSTVELLTLFGLSIDANIDFGSIVVGDNTGAYNATTTVSNTGNKNIDIQLSGTNLTGSASSIAVGEQKYATTTFAYSSCSICQFLTGSATSFEVDLPKPTSTTTPSADDVYWGINIPSGTGAVLHQGTNTFIATSD